MEPLPDMGHRDHARLPRRGLDRLSPCVAWALLGLSIAVSHGCDASHPSDVDQKPFGLVGATTQQLSPNEASVDQDGGQPLTHQDQLSPEQRRRKLALCFQPKTPCEEAEWSGIVRGAAEGREQAELEALVAVRRAAIDMLEVIAERSGPRARDDSTECNRASFRAVGRMGLALGRVEQTNTDLARIIHNPIELPTLPGRAWLKVAELHVRWCADCAPDHDGHCEEAKGLVSRAQAAMDVAGW